MEDSKKTKKTAAKKDVKFAEDDPQTAQAPKQELVFGAGSTDMVNFGGKDEAQKANEHNVIHLHYQQRRGRKCLTII